MPKRGTNIKSFYLSIILIHYIKVDKHSLTLKHERKRTHLSHSEELLKQEVRKMAV